MGNNRFLKVAVMIALLCGELMGQNNTVYNSKTTNKGAIYSKAIKSCEQIIENFKIPVYEINLEEISALKLSPEQIIDSKKDMKNYKYYLASISGLIAHRDTLVILDYKQNKILISDYSGSIIGEVGREGSGPGEYKSPQYLNENKKYYFIFDTQNSRIQILNKNYKYVKSLPATFYTMGRNIASSDDFLFLNEKIFVPCDISAYKLKDMSLKKTDLFDKNFNFNIDLLKGNNMLYGMLMAASLSRGQYIVAVTSFLPFIYVFNNEGKLLYAIRYSNKKIRELMKGNDPFGFTTLVMDVKIINNKLYVLMPYKILVYDLDKRKAETCLQFDGVGASQFAIYGNYLFLGNMLGNLFKAAINTK